MRWETALISHSEHSRRAVRESQTTEDSSAHDSWSHPSADDVDDNATSKALKRTRSPEAGSRLRAWEQNMKRNSRNGNIGNEKRSAANYSWQPTATVYEYSWGADRSAQLRIRNEVAESDHCRVEIDFLDLLRAVRMQTVLEGSTLVQEHFAVVRLDRDRPEVIFRQVMNGTDGDPYEQTGLVSSFGDPAAVVDLMRTVAERSGASTSTLLRSMYALQGSNELAATAISQLEELNA